MNYLITGSTGFIGGNIVELLTDRGDYVVELSYVAPSERARARRRMYWATFATRRDSKSR